MGLMARERLYFTFYLTEVSINQSVRSTWLFFLVVSGSEASGAVRTRFYSNSADWQGRFRAVRNQQSYGTVDRHSSAARRARTRAAVKSHRLCAVYLFVATTQS